MRRATGILGRALGALVLLASLGAAQAASISYDILLDTDRDAATGCSVALPAGFGSFAGVELVLATRVETSTDGAEVTGVTRRACSGGALGAPTAVSSDRWPVGFEVGTDATAVIETFLPLAALGNATQVHAAVMAATDEGGDALIADLEISAGGDPEPPLPPGGITPIPTLSPLVLALLAAALGLGGAWLARRHHAHLVVLAACVLLGAAGMAWAATIFMDGQVRDWAGLDPAVTGAKGDVAASAANVDLVALWFTHDAQKAYFRIDADVVLEEDGGPTDPTDPTDPPDTNHPPLLDEVPDQGVLQGQVLTYALTASDPDAGDVLRFSLTSAPSGMGVDSASGELSWFPTAGQLGGHAVTARVTDAAGAFAERSFEVTVTEIGNPPRLEPIADQKATPGSTLEITAVATDADLPDDTLSYSLVLAPDGAGIDAASGAIRWTPTAAQIGAHDFTVKVADAQGLTDFTSFIARVSGTNAAPVARDDVYVARVGQTLTVAAPGVMANDSDPDGDLLTAQIVAKPSKGSVTLNPNGSFSYEAGAAPGGPHDGTLSPVSKWSWQPETLPDSHDVNGGVTVCDLDGDGEPEVVFISSASSGGSGVLRAVRGSDAAPVFTVSNPALQVLAGVQPACGNLDGDPQPEIVALHESGQKLLVFGHDGSPKLESASVPDLVGPIALANLDTTGETVPEIIVARAAGMAVFNADGTLRWSTNGGSGRMASGGAGMFEVADINLDGVPDIVAGNTVYNANGTIKWIKNTLPDGPVAVGDFDIDRANTNPALRDLQAEIVLVSGGQVWMLEHTGVVKWGPVPIPGGGEGGPPVIIDFDNADNSGVGVAGSSRYVVLDRDGSVKWTAEVDGYSASAAGATVFDFLGDDTVDVVFRDRTSLRIFDGNDGTPLLNAPIAVGSATGTGYPVIADVDADGHADIVLGTAASPDSGLHAWTSQDWMPARKIWNQAAYHVTNVFESGEIPNVETAHWLTRFNNIVRGNPRPIDTLQLRGRVAIVPFSLGPDFRFPTMFRDLAYLWELGLEYQVLTPQWEGVPVPLRLTFDQLKDYDLVLRHDFGWRWRCYEVPVYRQLQAAGIPIYMRGDDLSWSASMEGGNCRDEMGEITLLTAGGNGEHWGRQTIQFSAAPHTVTAGPFGQVWDIEWRGDIDTGRAILPPGATLLAHTDHAAQRDTLIAFEHPLTGYRSVTQNMLAANTEGEQTNPDVYIVDERLFKNSMYWLLGADRAAETDRFTYRVSDGQGGTDVAAVHLDLRPANVAPEFTSRPPTDAAVGIAYSYDAEAVDHDVGDVLTFGMLDGPPGMTIVPGTGYVQWTPTATGSYEVVLQVADSEGMTAVQGYTIHVATAVTVPDVLGQVQSSAEAAIDAVGLKVGRVSQAYSQHFPAGQVMDQAPNAGAAVAPNSKVQIVLSLGPDPGDTDEPTLASMVIEPASVTLPEGASWQPTAVGTFTDGTQWSLNQVATWSSSDEAVASVDASGKVQAIAAGSATISASFQGQSASASVTVVANVPADTEPPSAEITQPTMGQTISEPIMVRGSAEDANFVRWQLDLAPTGTTNYKFIASGTSPVTDGDFGLLDPADFAPGNSELRLQAFDAGGNSLTVLMTVLLAGTPPPGGPGPGPGPGPFPPVDMVVLQPPSLSLRVGETFDMVAHGVYTDGSGFLINDRATWSSSDTAVATISANGRLTAVGAGSATISATFEGKSDTSTVEVVLVDDGDRTPPVAGITAPAMDAIVTAPVDVTGTATDANLVRWELALAAAGTDDFTPLASGTAGVSDGVLGRLDPTLLLNGYYDLRLQAFDSGLNVSTYTITIEVDGQQKVGAFTLAFTDLEIPVAGTPITVTRQYDSRDKRRGDFGVGWRLGVQSLELSCNGILGQGWYVVHSGMSFGLQPTRVHACMLRMANGETEIFDLAPTPNTSAMTPFPYGAIQARFKARPGTLGKLEALGDTALSILDPQPGPVELLGGTNDTVYNPSRFRYTARDGSKLVFGPTGLETLTDANGNTLTIDAAGISHSAGRSILFTRDALGRITKVTDPLGNVQTYGYSAAGDLAQHTDATANTTRYFYNNTHGLLRIDDPLGRPQVRTEYDADGRVISLTSASGRTTTFSHDLEGRKEIITDVDGATTVMEYDVDGNVTKVTDASGGVTLNTYDTAGNQTSTKNPAGEVTTRTFDIHRNLTSVTDPLGHTTTYTYMASGKPATVTDPLGRTTRFGYDSRGNLLTRVNALGITESANAYDASGNLVSTKDALGNVIQYTHDAYGNLAKLTDPRGFAETYVYNAAGSVVSSTDSRGSTTTAAYDRRGLLAAVTDAAGRSVQFRRTVQGQIEAVTSSAGGSYRDVIDAEGRATQRIDALGNVTTFTFGADGTLASVTTPAGDVTSFTYDNLDRLVQTVNADGSVSTATYDSVGRTTSVTDGKGNTTTFAYDAAGRRNRTIDPMGNATSASFDAAGNVASITNANGDTTHYTHDALNRLIAVAYPDGRTRSFGYDAVGKRTSITNESGATTHFAYDAAGNLVRVTDASGNVTRYAWDGTGHMAGHTDATGAATAYQYDALGRLVATVFPDGYSERRTYDRANNLASILDPNGNLTSFTYDGNGRLITKHFSDGTEASFTYTSSGLPATAANTNGIVSFTYGPMGRVQTVSRPQGSLNYTYDETGNLTTIKTSRPGVPDRTVSYAYDAVNRLTEVIDSNGLASAYAYDAVGQLNRLSRGNGTSTDFAYDKRGQIIEVLHSGASGTLARFAYDRDAVGDITQATDLDGQSLAYQYDSLRRLLRETRKDHTGTTLADHAYSYDAIGNRLSHDDLITGDHTAYAYGPAHRLLSAGDTSFTYDADGKLRSRTSAAGTTTLNWNAADQLVGATTPFDDLTYRYDAYGDRVGRSDTTTDIDYLIDRMNPTGFAQVLAAFETRGGTELARFAFGHGALSQTTPAQTSWFHADAPSSTRLMSGETGSLVATYSYDAFGGLVDGFNVGMTAMRYKGEWFDSALSMSYMRARWYDSSNDRFISRDPVRGVLGAPASLNPYLFANANPLAFSDPSGREFTAAGLNNVMVVGAVIGSTANGILAVVGGKSPQGIVADMAVGGIAGAIAPAAGAGVARLIQPLLVKQMGAVAATATLWVAVGATKGLVTTLGQAATWNSTADGRFPFGRYWALNSCLEMLFMRGELAQKSASAVASNLSDEALDLVTDARLLEGLKTGSKAGEAVLAIAEKTHTRQQARNFLRSAGVGNLLFTMSDPAFKVVAKGASEEIFDELISSMIKDMGQLGAQGVSGFIDGIRQLGTEVTKGHVGSLGGTGD